MAQKRVELLLVEDSDEDAELTLRALTKQNITRHILRVADGAQALDFFFGGPSEAGASDRPRVVLLDLKLPGVSGLEVLQKLRADARTRSVPVVVLTASGAQADLEKAYAFGVNSYIVKPVEFEEFMRAVEQLGTYWGALNVAPASGL